MKILIIDDSLLDRKLLVNMLKKAGIENEILQAADGEEGLKTLSAHYKDLCLILLDWQMAKMNGIEFMSGVVKVPEVAYIPIVMITASGSEDNKRVAKQTNPNLAGYVVKPYTSDQLLQIIRPFIK